MREIWGEELVGEIKIETYWNVNSLDRAAFLVECTIKIETYWNVNVERKATVSNKRSGLK